MEGLRLSLWAIVAVHTIWYFVYATVGDEVAVDADDRAVSSEVHVGHVQAVQFAALAERHSTIGAVPFVRDSRGRSHVVHLCLIYS